MNPIDVAMQSDHERLDQLLVQTAAAVEKQDWENAARHLAHFRHGIEAGHMVVEEETLFPAFEKREGGGEHPLTSLLRKGHQDLRVFFAELADAVAAHDAEEFNDLLSTVQVILHQHDAKEESELYPFLAAALPDHGEAATQRLAALAGEDPA